MYPPTTEGGEIREKQAKMTIESIMESVTKYLVDLSLPEKGGEAVA